MRTDILDIIAKSPQQGTDEWLTFRKGLFTGSVVGKLMKIKKDGKPSAEVETYIQDVVEQRTENRTAVVGDYDRYKYINEIYSKAVNWGHEQEDEAVYLYQKLIGNKVTRCGSILHPTLACFADSPDGLLLDVDGCIEVKCPMRKTHLNYILNISNQDDLLKIEPEYYWQTMSHMSCTGASFCDWMSYYPFSTLPLWVVRIERDTTAINNLTSKIAEAEIIVNNRLVEFNAKKQAMREIIKAKGIADNVS